MANWTSTTTAFSFNFNFDSTKYNIQKGAPMQIIFAEENPSGNGIFDSFVLPVIYSLSTLNDGSAVKMGQVTDSGIKGKALLGPICPVERIPPDPACQPKPYATSLKILNENNDQAAQIINIKTDGTFVAFLPAGIYKIFQNDNKMLPRLEDPGLVTVKAHAFTNVSLSFDTGIR